MEEQNKENSLRNPQFSQWSPLWFDDYPEESFPTDSVKEKESSEEITKRLCTAVLWCTEENKLFLSLGNYSFELTICSEEDQILLHIIKEAPMSTNHIAAVPLALEVGSIEIPLEDFLKLSTGDFLCFTACSPLTGIIRCGQIHIGYGSLHVKGEEVSLEITEIFSQPAGNISADSTK